MQSARLQIHGMTGDESFHVWRLILKSFQTFSFRFLCPFGKFISESIELKLLHGVINTVNNRLGEKDRASEKVHILFCRFLVDYMTD